MQEDESFPKPFSLAITDSPRGRQNYRFDREELIKRTDLEEETIDEVRKILNAEFNN